MPCLDFSLRTDRSATDRAAPAFAPRGLQAPIGSGRSGPWVRAASGACVLACAILAAASPTPAGSTANPAPVGVGEADLLQRARAWLGAIHQVSPSAVQVQPLDARLQVAPCAAGWAFDKPFPQNETVVRARCQDTQWSLFLSITLPRTAVAARSTSMPGALPATQPPNTAPVAVLGPATAPTAPPGAAPVAYPTTTWVPGGSQTQAAAVTPLAVRRGNTVVTVWTPTPGLTVSARLESLDDGRLGDTIRLRNRDTGRVVSAQISGQNQAVGQ